jgi:hypothetical protein
MFINCFLSEPNLVSAGLWTSEPEPGLHSSGRPFRGKGESYFLVSGPTSLNLGSTLQDRRSEEKVSIFSGLCTREFEPGLHSSGPRIEEKVSLLFWSLY